MAQTLKFGNGTWATKKGSTLAYNDEGGNFKPLPFNYTGAGKGTRVNKEGLIEVVENDRPRIDYLDSEDGVFLLEKAATNLITYSEDFSQSYWTKANTSILSNEVISPDGSLNSDKLYEDTASSTKLMFKTGISTLGTISVFAKKGDESNRLFQIRRDGGSNSWSWFNLENGTIENEENGSSSIENYGNGWYRCSFTPTNSNSTIVFGISKGGLGRSVSYTGDGTSGVYVWGAQVESGNVSSYIPTQGTIQTRVQETATGSGNSEVFNDSEGILYANIAAFDNDSTAKVISISQSSSNILGFYYYESRIDAYVKVGTNQFLKTYYLEPTINNKISLKYKTNDFALWVNGFEVGTGASGTTPSGLNQLSFTDIDNNNFYGKTKEIAYYDEVLTDLELETLTSYRTWEAMVKELNLNIIHNE